jgi:hypothetical protein
MEITKRTWVILIIIALFITAAGTWSAVEGVNTIKDSSVGHVVYEDAKYEQEVGGEEDEQARSIE